MSATEAPTGTRNDDTKFATSRNGKTLDGRTVLVIGGTAGIGLETARLSRAHGADLILTARNADQLKSVGLELGARTAAFDATDFTRLKQFFGELSTPIDHVLLTGPGPTTPPCRTSISTKHGATCKPISSCLSRSLNVPLERFARKGPCCS